MLNVESANVPDFRRTFPLFLSKERKTCTNEHAVVYYAIILNRENKLSSTKCTIICCSLDLSQLLHNHDELSKESQQLLSMGSQ